MKHFIFFVILAITSCGPYIPREYGGSTSGSRLKDDMPKGPGCYAKVLMPDQYGLKGINHYFEYTGHDYNSPNVQLVEKSTEATTRWEKKKADRNCLSANPEDCLVWCLVEVPAEFYSYYEVLDTNEIKEFKRVDNRRVIVKHGGYTEWQRVVCDNSISESLIVDVKDALRERGFSQISETNFFDEKSKAALATFQKDSGLGIGQLSFETLDSLGVDYLKE